MHVHVRMLVIAVFHALCMWINPLGTVNTLKLNFHCWSFESALRKEEGWGLCCLSTTKPCNLCVCGRGVHGCDGAVRPVIVHCVDKNSNQPTVIKICVRNSFLVEIQESQVTIFCL